MKRPLLDRFERIYISSHDDLYSDKLKAQLIIAHLNRSIGRAVLPLIKWLSFRGKSDVFQYLYYFLWLMKLSGMIAIMFYILNR